MIEHAFLTLVHLSMQLGLILLALLPLRPLLLRLFGATCTYLAWLLVPLMLAVAHLPASRPGLVLHQLIASDVPQAIVVAPLAVNDGFELQARCLLTLWVLGMAAVAAVLVIRQRRFARSLRFDAVHDGWRGPADSGPALVGVLRPRLCLPGNFEQRFTPAQQALIRAHEEVHRRRGDNAWNLLAAALCGLQWFNPLVWYAARAMRADQELSCDEAVLRSQPTQAADYAHALLQAQGSQGMGLPWASWRSNHPLVERISMLKTHAHARRKSGLAVLLTLGLFSGGGVHALQSEQRSEIRDADVKLDLSLEYSETVDGKRDRWEMTTTVAAANNSPVHLKLPIRHVSGADDELELIVSAAPHANGQWKIGTELRQAHPAKTLAKPWLITANGAKAIVEVGDKDADGKNQHMIRVGVTPTDLHPQGGSKL